VTRLGYLAVAAAAVLWAVGGTYAQTLFARGASPIELTEARAWIAAAGMGIIALVRGPDRARRDGPRRSPLLLVPFGLSIAAANASYYLALSLLPVAVAIVVQYSAPALVVLWKSAGARKTPSGRVALALLLTFAGVVLVSKLHEALGGQTDLSYLGVAIALVSAVAFGLYILLGEAIGDALAPERALLYGFSVAGVFWVGVQVVRGRPETLLDPQFAWPILFLGVFTTIVPFLLFVWGLRIVRASMAGIVSTLEPVGAALLAFVWLGQALDGFQILGAAAVIVGVAVVQTERPPVPEVLVERAAVE
jgi:drug/metabolite transporter (DMT)-like permease